MWIYLELISITFGALLTTEKKLGVTSMDPLTHFAIWSLGVNGGGHGGRIQKNFHPRPILMRFRALFMKKKKLCGHSKLTQYSHLDPQGQGGGGDVGESYPRKLFPTHNPFL